MATSILVTIENQLNYYGYPIFMTLGNVGNVFVVVIFSRQRRNACAIYLLSSAIMNDIYLTFNSFVEIFPFYYADESPRAFALCKIRFYLSNVLGQIAKTMIVLACIDRFVITNDRVHFRALSTPKRARWCIFISILFWPLFASHIAIMTTIINTKCGTFGAYSAVYTIYSVLFVGLIPPLILSIFGYFTYRNMRKVHRRVHPIFAHPRLSNGNIPIRRRDRELLIIVISETFVYIVTTTLYALILLEMLISGYVLPTKSDSYSQIEHFIFTIAFLLAFVNTAAPFYIYIIASRSFRFEFKQLMINCYRKLRNQPTVRIVRRTNPHTLTPQGIHT